MRVLVIEDDPATAGFICQQLQQRGYAADEVGDGGEAYERARDGDYDLIILDVLLPTLDGVSLCRQLRKDGNAVPVLMLSRAGSIDHRVAGLNAGANDYLVKPFAMRELVARLRALARASSQGGQTQLTVGDLTLDLVTRAAERSGDAIHLTEREFALLKVLMRRAGETVSRATLAAEVWGYDFDYRSNVVEAYISRLRSKIDQPFSTPLIHTDRGAGYRIAAPDGKASPSRA